MSAGAPLVSVRHLCVRFPVGRGEAVKAVDGVSFDVDAGETFGIIGESGSGKSTIGRTLVSLLEPTSGVVLHDGVDLSTLSRSELRLRRRPYQIIFQDPNAALDPRMTILQSVREPLDIVGELDPREREAVALRCLDHVGLTRDHGRRHPHELSGGQKQRANIARVLTVQPRLVVCDEAVAALDVSIRAEILNLFSELQREFGLAYVFITHDLGIVSHVSRRVAVMYLGVFVETGPVEEVLSRPLHPYTEALTWSQPLPVPASMRTRERKVLQGEIPSPVNPPSGCRFHTRCPHAQPRCSGEVPQWRELAAGRWVACHFAGDVGSVSMT
ncbi:MAG: ABC transporter ATP-binding protein [Burkholderiaceae bacterium]|nr:ABC transporter ATP-binding protein [Burkholderiaceae bacterium]MEB2351203.1 ABC transporter ATP-binding protein [Burkholderiaceae bacterium]